MNWIQRRRRELMGAKKTADPSLLFAVKNFAMDGTAGLDTGVKLMDEDKDFTIIFDITVISHGSGQYRIAHCLESTSPFYGIGIWRGGTNTSYVCRWCSSYSEYYNTLPASGGFRIRASYSHYKNSGKAVYYAVVDDGSVVRKNSSASYRQNDSNLAFNGTNDKNRWAGTINRACVYSRVLSEREIYDFFNDIKRPVTVDYSAVGSPRVSGVKQGGCTDGTYLYALSFPSDYSSATIVKQKISDRTYTTKEISSGILGHGNDMAYNPTNGHFYVACMTTDGAVVELDENLDVVQTHYLADGNGSAFSVWSLAYDRVADKFYTGIGKTRLIVYDSALTFEREIVAAPIPFATAQGWDTDGTYIYRLSSMPGYISIINMDGSLSRILDLNHGMEQEAIMFDWATGKFYYTINANGSFFWKVEIN